MATKKNLSLSKLLQKPGSLAALSRSCIREELEKLQLRMLRIQQGIWHRKARAIIVFEGFDAAGKGGAIRRLTKSLDPRSLAVHSIGPPSPEDQGKHWLYRFWTKLPAPGTIAIFDRSWYGRVLVERVDKLISPKDWERGYDEINEFERCLVNDGVVIVKIFLAISKKEQFSRFEARLRDPYKQWKITPDDFRARRHWDDYVVAVDEIFRRTDSRGIPWNLVPADDKESARCESLRIVVEGFASEEKWMLAEASKMGKKHVARALKELREELRE